MGIRFVITGNTADGGGAGTYDHNLLINRGLPDQHTIESVTGLREALNRKYEKPFMGIPRTDLAFDVATLRDLDILRNTDIADIINNLTNVTQEISIARGDRETLKEYIDSKVSYGDWTGGGSGEHVDSQVGYPLYEEYKAEDKQRLFELNRTYEMGTKQLEVYLNGILMSEERDYLEINDQTVEFLYDLEDDDIVLFKVRAVINSGLYEDYTASEGQTEFKLTDPYGLHQNILRVFRNGVLQRKGRDYTEVDNRTIVFKVELEEGDYITFTQAGATDPISGTIMESEIGRLKINHAFTTMMLHDATQTEETDYMDMYVDTFITNQNIDHDQSFTHVYENNEIKVGEGALDIKGREDFLQGNTNGTDIHSYPDMIRLSNLPGGTESNSFGSYIPIYNDESEIVNDVIFLQNKNKDSFYFASVTTASGVTNLKVKINQFQSDGSYVEVIKTLHYTDGYFFNLSADTDRKGHIHLVFHEQGSALHMSRVFYLQLSSDGYVIQQDVISDERHDAVTPNISVEPNGDAHIVFSSKRTNETYFNVDYRYYTNGFLSGFKDISVQTLSDALNPSISIGSDSLVRIVYETKDLEPTTKNIKLCVVDDGVKIREMYLTTSSIFDNTNPDIAMDSENRARVVWRSKRMSSHWGLDYCHVNTNYSISSVRSVTTGQTNLTHSIPSIAVDYEDIAHIVFHANVMHEHYDNICYAYIYPNGDISPFENIAVGDFVSYTDPVIYIYGDEIKIGFINETSAYEIRKTIGNYIHSGRYDIIFDSTGKDSSWIEFSSTEYLPEDTSIEYQYRLTNDQVLWTEWKEVSQLSSDEAIGRYIHIRAILQTDNLSKTPEVHLIKVVTNPESIYVQSIPKKLSDKDITSAIVVPRYDGEIEFFLSRDGGTTFIEAAPLAAVNLSAQPFGDEIVIRAKIKSGSVLKAWAVVW